MASQGGTYITDPGGTGQYRSLDQSRHGYANDLPIRGTNSAYGGTPTLSGTGGNGIERVPGLSSPPAELSRPLTQFLSLAPFEIGDERWPHSRELERATDEARPEEGEDSAQKVPPRLWTSEDAARLVTALNEVQAQARERASRLTGCLNKLDRWQNQVANRKRKKEMQGTGASGGSLSSGNVGSGPLLGGDPSRGTAPQPAKKLRTSLVDVGAARPAKNTWAAWDSPRGGVSNSANTESEEGGEASRSKKKRTRKSEANGDASWHEETRGEGKVGKIWLGKKSQGGVKRYAEGEEKRTPGKNEGVLKGMRGPRTANPAHLVRLKSFTGEGRNAETPKKKPPPSGPVGGEKKRSPLGSEKKRPASRSPSPSRSGNPNKAARLARTNSAALKLLRDDYIYPAEKPLTWNKEKKAPSEWKKSPKGGVLKVEKEGLVIEAPDGAHIAVLKKSHKKGGSAQYRKDMEAIANRLQSSGFKMDDNKKKKAAAKARSSRFKAPSENERPESRNGDATPSSENAHEGFSGGLDSWGKPVRSKRTTRQGPERAAKKMIGLQDDSDPESDEELENELVVAFETLPQTLQERVSSDFWREVEPYFAALKEEDLRFLRENFRELKQGDVILSVPRCGEHFRKLWANEDQAWRFLVDDNAKSPANESEETNGAEVWLEHAKKVALSQRLLAALIDENETPEKGETAEVLDSLPAAYEVQKPLSPNMASPLNGVQLAEVLQDANRPFAVVNKSEDGADKPANEMDMGLFTAASDCVNGSSGRFEEQGNASQVDQEAVRSVKEDVKLTSGEQREGLSMGAADSRGLDERLRADEVIVAEPSVSEVTELDEDAEILNGGAVGEQKGAVERSAWEQKFEAMTLDERIRWELQSIGLVDDKEEEPELREDDPVCFELRSLQRHLREQLDADNARLEALEQKASAERANEERDREKWALFHFLEKLYERRKGARAGLGPGSSKGGKGGTAHKKLAAKEAFLATAKRALRKLAQFEAGASVVPRGRSRYEERPRDFEEAPTPTDVQARARASRSAAAQPLAVKDDRKAQKMIVGDFAAEIPVVHSKGQRTKLTKRAKNNNGKRKTGPVANGFAEKEVDLESMRLREAEILAEAQASAAAAEAAAHAEAEQQALNLGPTNFDMDFSALPLPMDMAVLNDDAFGGGFEGFEIMGAEFNELAELDKFGLDDLGDMGF